MLISFGLFIFGGMTKNIDLNVAKELLRKLLSNRIDIFNLSDELRSAGVSETEIATFYYIHEKSLDNHFARLLYGGNSSIHKIDDIKKNAPPFLVK